MKLFEDVVDEKTGNHSLTENIVPKLLQTYCKDGEHYWVLEDPKSRELTCSKCGMGSMLNVGMYELVDGKLTVRVN